LFLYPEDGSQTPKVSVYQIVGVTPQETIILQAVTADGTSYLTRISGVSEQSVWGREKYHELRKQR
jgi:hypothetical protein